MQEYPAPVAVACALSSSPSRFFTELVNRHLFEVFRLPTHKAEERRQPQQLTLGFFDEETLRSFLSRLLLENPFFDVNTEFGRCVLCMFAFYYFRHGHDVDVLLERFLRLSGVMESLRAGALDELIGNPVLLARNTAVLRMDNWFWRTYALTTGHIPKDLKRFHTVPFVLFPATALRDIWTGGYAELASSPEVLERLTRELRGTRHQSLLE